MNELGPHAKQLLKLGQPELDPSLQDKARVRALLRARLPVAAPASPDAGSLGGAAYKTTPWPLLSTLTLGAGALIGAIAWGLASQSGSGPVHVQASPLSQAVESAPTSDSIVERVPSAGVTPTPPAAETTTVPPVPVATSPSREASVSSSLPSSLPSESHTRNPGRGNQLGEEVALLSRATAALHAGQAEAALRVLAEHQKRFSKGALGMERRAARAQALCLLGRKAEAERELEHLPASTPQAARAREFCAAK